jgi:hypothetical protein
VVLKKNSVSETDRTNESIISEINKCSELTQNHQRRWNMNGHILRYKYELDYRIIEGKIDSKRNEGYSRTSFVEKMISDAEVSIYMELKRLAENRVE